jgi:microcystin synthetase protein McyD
VQQNNMSDVAVIGMACRFPGAEDPDAFWDLISARRAAIRIIPDERWKDAEFFDPNPGTVGKTYTHWAGLIDGVDLFDAVSFGISAMEAERMDPQQRVILEVTRDAFESAGLPLNRLAGTQTGVFMGISTFDYTRIVPGDPASIDMYWGTGSALSIAANRLSYAFDLCGPSIAVDTACSSALVALHLACRSLSEGECNVAVAGGVNLLLAPDLMIAFSAARMMAADGRCKAFDAAADGYVRGEGCGVVVLKRLQDACADGDMVLAVVRGSAVNQDGRTNGMTAPNGRAQESVIATALRNAGAEPTMIGYVEAHGTGTPLGDPIEAAALGAVLGANRPPHAPLAIGSAKTNVGHLEAAAGMAGLIKTVQALRHGQIPPSLNFDNPNPRIAFEELGLRVATELADWPADQPLAGVSSFGFGGTNAHIVLAPPPLLHRTDTAQPASCILVVSAPHSALLTPLVLAHAAALEGLSTAAVADYCYSAAVRRSQYDHRLAVTGEDGPRLAALLGAAASGENVPGAFKGRRPLSGIDGPIFSFDGDTSQASATALSLLSDQPVIRRTLAECDRLPFLATRRLNPDRIERGVDERARNEDCPLLVALGLALADLWASCGIRASAVSGHGAGEIAAAATAGVLQREDALRLALEWEDASCSTDPEGAGTLLKEKLAWLKPGRAEKPFYSETWARAVDGESLDAAYWGALLDRVRQGPLTRACPAGEDIVPIGAPGAGLTPSQSFAHILCALFARGHDVDWRGAFPAGGTFTKLPTTPFRRSKYWRGRPPGSDDRAPRSDDPFRPFRLRTALPVWEAGLGNLEATHAGRHLLGGAPVLPMSVGLSVASVAAGREAVHQRVQLADVAFLQLIRIGAGARPRLQVIFDSPGGEARTIKLYVADFGSDSDDGSWQLWMTARVEAMPSLTDSLNDARGVSTSRHRILERLDCPPTASSGESLSALLSEAMELFRRIETSAESPPLVPASVRAVAGLDNDVPGDATVWALASLDARGHTGQLVLWDQTGRCICRLDEIRFRAHPAVLRSQRPGLDCAYRLDWRELAPREKPLSWSDYADKVRQTLDRAVVPEPSANAAEFTRRLDPICIQFIANALRTMGWRPSPGDQINLDGMLSLCRIAPGYRRLTARLLEMLTEDGFLAISSDGWIVLQALPAADADAACRDLLAILPSFHREIELLWSCGLALADVMRGKVDALEFLFSGSRRDLIEGLYNAAPTMMVANRTIADAVAAGMTGGPRYRILEIGGGTGGTTAHLLERLSGSPVDYLFTDISPAFLNAAQARFGAVLERHGTFSVRRLDIETDPVGQGFEQAQYDFIVVANVLHATQDLSEALLHIRGLLAPNGILIVLEQTGKQRLLDLVFGLTPGWWRFTDTAIRSCHPLLTADEWHSLFEAAGLDLVHSPADTSDHEGQHVFLAHAARTARFLVLTDDAGRASIMQAEFAALGESAVVLAHPSEPSACRERALTSENWRAIVVMDESPLDDGFDLRATLQQAAGETLRVLRALARIDKPPPLYLVTRNGVVAMPEDDPDPFAGLLWGLGRTAAAEMPGLWGGLIDIDGSPESLTALALELTAPGGEPEIALRTGRRFVPALARQSVPNDNTPGLRPDVSYLVTGGFGSIALLTAEWLATHGARHLVLCNRSPPSPAVRERVSAMTAGGATVVTTETDVADEQALASLLARFGNDLPPLKGIVHAAGSTGDGILAGLDPARGLDAQTDKVLGAYFLSRNTERMDLDFLVFYSSAAAVFGEAGSGLYTAANAYLDAFAVSLAKRGRPASSIAFGPVAGTRMLEAATDEQQRRWRQTGILPLDPVAAMTAVGHVFADKTSALIVMNIDWGTVASGQRRSPLLDEMLAATSAGVVAAPRPAKAAEPLRSVIVDDIRRCHPAERPRRIELYLQNVMAKVLNLPDGRMITAGEGFQSLGMDSLTALTFTDLLQRECGVRLSSTTIFEYPNISTLSQLLTRRLTEGAPQTADPAKARSLRVDNEAPSAFQGLIGDLAILDDLAAWQEIDRGNLSSASD